MTQASSTWYHATGRRVCNGMARTNHRLNTGGEAADPHASVGEPNPPKGDTKPPQSSFIGCRGGGVAPARGGSAAGGARQHHKPAIGGLPNWELLPQMAEYCGPVAKRVRWGARAGSPPSIVASPPTGTWLRKRPGDVVVALRQAA